MAFTDVDRLLFVRLYHLAPGVLDALKIVKPETRSAGTALASGPIGAGDQGRAGRPPTPLELCLLIRNVSLANPLWGAPRIRGELLKLGIEIGTTGTMPTTSSLMAI